MNKSTKDRLVRLNARLDKHVEFVAYDPNDDQRDQFGNRIVKTAAVVGGAGALYGAQAALRGRAITAKFRGYTGGSPTDNTLGGLWNSAKLGHNANVADVGSAISRVKPIFSSAAGTVGSAANTVGNTISNTAGMLANKGIAAGRSAKAAVLIAARRARGIVP